MSKTFDEKTAYELEQEMHTYFDGSIDRIAINYWRTKQEYLAELDRKRGKICGYYSVKNQYFKKGKNLPFVIMYYVREDKTYRVLSVYYRGFTRCKSDAYYTEKTIHEYIETGLIKRVSGFDETDSTTQVQKLVASYRNAKKIIE